MEQLGHLTDKTTQRNAFVALCDLASREDWCWNLTCTTCGHVTFRQALKDLSDGAHPDSANWRLHRRRILRNAPRSLTIEEQHALVRVVSGASLRDIIHVSKFPDWLGFYGLALNYTRDAERENGGIPRSLIPQMRELFIELGEEPPLSFEERSGMPLLLGLLEDWERILQPHFSAEGS